MDKKNLQHPTFVCIGAQKAGTTWLYDNLRQHPEVWLPPVKELHFFNTVCPHQQLLGVETYNHIIISKIWRNFIAHPSLTNIRWLKQFYLEQKSTQWYQDLFAKVPTGKCSGDMTPGYTTLDERGVAFARQVLTDSCKVFVILRNPVERLWSSLKMNYRWKGENVQKEELTTLLDEMRIPSNYLRTDYVRIIKLWQSYFPNFRVFLFDDLVKDPLNFLFEIEEYLGIKQFSSADTLMKKSNADKKNITLPPEIKKELMVEYAGELDKLETLLPGIKARWFGQ